ncbi:hypothetical protein HOE04_02065 [archaeon]|jgi:hypothetical protein|nr:hypothetical protein [archaeon]
MKSNNDLGLFIISLIAGIGLLAGGHYIKIAGVFLLVISLIYALSWLRRK